MSGILHEGMGPTLQPSLLTSGSDHGRGRNEHFSNDDPRGHIVKVIIVVRHGRRIVEIIRERDHHYSGMSTGAGAGKIAAGWNRVQNAE